MIMELVRLIKSLVRGNKDLDLGQLPSRGLFYPEDFWVKIKRASSEQIVHYETNFVEKDMFSIIESIKRIVEANAVFPENYNFRYLKVIDLIWVFLEIVKFTQDKKININYFDSDSSLVKEVEISSDSFNYFNFTKFEKFYNNEEKIFEMQGYRFSLPSIGVESDLLKYLNSKSAKKSGKDLSELNYNFIFFLGMKDGITKKEIENLITIFNDDLDKKEIDKINEIIEEFSKSIKYTLKIGKKVIDLQSKIQLKEIFR